MATSNVADVFNSIINMVGTATTIIVIFLSVSFARRFGKKAVTIAGFTLSAVNAFATYLLKPTDVYGMVALTMVGSIVYAPTIPLIWAIFADCADYSEWKTGRRFTGMVFATIGFALKAGLALGSASIALDSCRLFPLRHEISRGAGSRSRLPRLCRHRRRHHVRHLHDSACSFIHSTNS